MAGKKYAIIIVCLFFSLSVTPLLVNGDDEINKDANLGLLMSKYTISIESDGHIHEYFSDYFDINVTVANNRCLFPRPFYIAVIVEPHQPVPPFYKILYTQVIGLEKVDEKIPMGSNKLVSVRCRASAIQSVELGDLSAFIVFSTIIPPKWSLHRFFGGYSSNKVPINFHNPFDELTRINITEYEPYEIDKDDGIKYNRSKHEGNVWVNAGEKFAANLTIKNYCGLKIDKVKVDIVVIKPSAVGISFSRERIIVGTAYFDKLGGNETRTEQIICNIPPDMETGYYENEAVLSVHMGTWVPSPDTVNGTLIKIKGKPSSIDKISTYFTMLIPILFSLAIVFVIIKKYIYQKMDEYYKKKSKNLIDKN